MKEKSLKTGKKWRNLVWFKSVHQQVRKDKNGKNQTEGKFWGIHAIINSGNSFQTLSVQVLPDFACLLRERLLKTVKMAIWKGM